MRLLLIVLVFATLLTTVPAFAQPTEYAAGPLNGGFGDILECRAANVGDTGATILLVLHAANGSVVAGPVTPQVEPAALATLSVPAFWVPAGSVWCSAFSDAPIAGSLTVRRAGIWTPTDASLALHAVATPEAPEADLPLNNMIVHRFSGESTDVECTSDGPYVGHVFIQVGAGEVSRVSLPDESGGISLGFIGPQLVSFSFAGPPGSDFGASNETGNGAGILSLETRSDATSGCVTTDP